MALIDLVKRKAEELGLKCQHTRTYGKRHSKWLVIEGRPCQVVSARIYRHPDSTRIAVYGLYLPASHWPDFLIYVSMDKQGLASFFVVPRGEATKSTSLCAPENWLFKYKDAWSLLSENLAPERLERRFEELNWKLQKLITVAQSKRYNVQLIPKGKWPGHVQNRIRINGRQCQVMSASRLSSDRNAREWKLININPPRNTWAEFLIFILPSDSEQTSIFIVPRERIQKKTTTSITAKWINECADRWDLLAPI
jgi:hypothetical protein